MTGGDIAGLIAAGVFAILVALLAVPIIKLGRVFDELRIWIRDLNDETEPLIDEVVRTVATTNSQLEKVDGITDNVSDASANVSAMTSLVASTVGQPIIKVAAFSSGVRRAFSPEAARARRQQERNMRTATAPAHDDVAGFSAAETAPESGAADAEPRSAARPWWEGTEFDTPAASAGASETRDSAATEGHESEVPEVIEPEIVEGDSTPGSDHADQPVRGARHRAGESHGAARLADDNEFLDGAQPGGNS